jgi:phage gp45-like
MNIKPQFHKIHNRVSNYIKKVYVSLSGQDSGDYSNAQITYYGKTTYSQTLYPYGISANAPSNTLGLSFNLSGQEENLMVIPYAAKERFKNLKSGEVVFGSPAIGSYVKFLANGDIEISSKNKVIITAASDINITTTGNLNINANKVTISADIEQIGNTFKTNAKVDLGAGGEAIARKGDEVTVGGNTGTITGGSSNNTSA